MCPLPAFIPSAVVQDVGRAVADALVLRVRRWGYAAATAALRGCCRADGHFNATILF